ncbi:MAG: hypothetical protein KJ601_01940 [Nanoarchaeota archaeon]|nr:hypothetical protein [Nanoarchaeota archaeon]MBU1704881.1 hypothetical protein [Nanoarchaeota archaeon]
MQKICFFYKREVPDFGADFLYLKLGRRERIDNSNDYNVIFEADLPINLSEYNEHLMDYSGLYALHMNKLINEKHMLIIHYDTMILDKEWLKKIEKAVRKDSVVFCDRPVDRDITSEVSLWVYKNIDKAFLRFKGKSFLDCIKQNNVSNMVLTSQFACSADTFSTLMEFMLPLYGCLDELQMIGFKFAHLLERSLGLFFSAQGYVKVPVIRDSQSTKYRNGRRIKLDFPVLTRCIKDNASAFSEVL